MQRETRDIGPASGWGAGLVGISLLAALPSSVVAAESSLCPIRTPIEIAATAIGDVEVGWTRSVLLATLEGSGDSSMAAMTAYEAARDRALAALEVAGVAADDVNVSRLSVLPVYGAVPGPIVAWRANALLGVAMADPGVVSGLMDLLSGAGVTRWGGIVNREFEQVEADREAARRAAANAETVVAGLAEARGLEIVRVVSLSTEPVPGDVDRPLPEDPSARFGTENPGSRPVPTVAHSARIVVEAKTPCAEE